MTTQGNYHGLLKYWWVFVLGYIIRAGIIIYSSHIDQLLPVKYTDVDYRVFTDAAHLVWQGYSPYDRSTYRYSPLIAYLVLPNVFITDQFGKHLFAILDCLTALMICLLLLEFQKHCSLLASITPRRAMYCSLFYLLNPLSINLSTRGSMDVVVIAMLYLILLSLQKGWIQTAAIFYALSIHIRIYPIIFAPSVFLYFVALTTYNQSNVKSPSVPPQSNHHHDQHSTISLWEPIKRSLPFFFTTAVINILLLVGFYAIYGYPFIYEAYLYHVQRKDTRHNFSPHFLSQYLTNDYFTSSKTLALVTSQHGETVSPIHQSGYHCTDHSYLFNVFGIYPAFSDMHIQKDCTAELFMNDLKTWIFTILSRFPFLLVLFILLLVVAYYLFSIFQKKSWGKPTVLPLGISFFLSSLLFVALNKVITAQYFLWFISFCPLYLAVLLYSTSHDGTRIEPGDPSTSLRSSSSDSQQHRSSPPRWHTWIKVFSVCGLWLLTETLWLLSGLYIEVKGIGGVYWLMMMGCSFLLFAVHMFIVWIVTRQLYHIALPHAIRNQK